MPAPVEQRVELQVKSKLPSREDLKGLTTVLTVLNAIDRKIDQINSKAISPRGIQGMASTAATAAIRQQTAALNQMAEAQARVNRAQAQGAITKISNVKNAKTAAESSTVTERIGTGVTQTRRYSNRDRGADSLESVKTEIDLAKITKMQQQQLAKEEADAYRQMQENARRNVAMQKAADVSEREAARSSKQAEKESSAAWADRNQSRKSDRNRAFSEMEAMQSAEQKRIERNTRREIEIFEESKRSGDQERVRSARRAADVKTAYGNAEKELEFLRRLDDLKASGFQRRSRSSSTNARGVSTAEEIYERLTKTTRERVSVSSSRNSLGLLTGTQFSETEAFKRPKPPPLPGASPLDVALKSITPAGLLSKFLSVTSYTVAAVAIASAIGMVTHAFETMIGVQEQAARLSQVFRSNTASAVEHSGVIKSLTDDVLALAAANGRASDEAIQASIQWSRMGLTQKEVNEAVRVSLMGANVAELTTAETTKYLSSLMATYQLKVSDLNGVLGMLNNTSNTYNVTNTDLLEGLSRVGAVAAQTGLSLAELQGLIGSAVGRTGNSGSQIGNALKSVMVAIGNPDIQEFLRGHVGVEVTKGGGSEMKDMSSILQELYVAWTKLNEAEKENAKVKIAGRTQANRFVAILDGYITAQLLAIDAQRNLNSAEAENAKILGTTRTQLVGVRTEWERMITIFASQRMMSFGGASINSVSTALFSDLRKSLALMNDFQAAGARLAEGIFGKKFGMSEETSTRSLLNVIPGGGLLNAASDIYDRLHPNDRFINESTRKSAGFSAASQASGMESRLFKTVSDVLPNLSKEDQLQRLEQIRGSLGEDYGRTRSALLGGNIAGAQQVLGMRSGRAQGVSEADAQASIRLAQEGAAAMQDEIDTLRAQGGDMKRITELERERLSLLGQQKKIMAEMADLTDYDTTKQERTSFISGTQLRLKNIGEMFGQMPVTGHVDQMNVKVATLVKQLETLEARRNEMESMSGKNGVFAPVEGGNEIEKIRDEIRKAKAELDADRSRGNAQHQAQLDRGQAGLDLQRANFARADVGLDPADRLLSTEKELRRQSAEASAKIDNAHGDFAQQQDAILQGLQAEVALKELLLKKDQMRAQLEADKKNLLLEQKRAYQESLLMSGPADLVRKLIVQRAVNKGNVSAGDFLSMGVQAKQDFAQLTGMFALGRLNRQMDLLGPGRTTEQAQAEDREGAIRRGKFIEHAPVALPTLRFNQVAVEAVAALTEHNSILGQVNKALVGFAQNLHAVFPTGNNAKPGIAHGVDQSKQ